MRILRLSQTHLTQIHPALSPHNRTRRQAFLIASLAAVALLASLTFARAASATAGTESYGEVTHFGGFAAGEVAEKFDLPAGFAVEPENPSTHEKNAVYVLDRTVFYEEEAEQAKLGYRLQKLSGSTGAQLGTVKLPVELSGGSEDFEEEFFATVHPLISLAVDPAKGRVYALVESLVNEGISKYVPVADELVAWSTTPNGSNELEKAAGYSNEDAITHAALVANLLKSQPSEDLYAPEGIAVNPKTHEVVIEAQEGVKSPHTGGPTILQPVVTEGPDVGTLGTPWVAGGPEQSDGLFAGSNQESFGVDLFTSHEKGENKGEISRLVDVSSDFAKSSPIAEDTSGGLNKDEAPTLDNEYTINHLVSRINGQAGDGALEAYAAGSPVTQLTNNLYAARYGHYIESLKDGQSNDAPWNSLGEQPLLWTQGVSEDNGIANEGIRLFEADGHIVTTIGGQQVGQECNLKDEAIALAAGAEGSVFVLSEPNRKNSGSDDEVIEFSPSAPVKCPASTGGHIEVNKQPAISTITVTQGKPVAFDAFSIERQGETPFSFEWYFEGTGEEPASKTYAPPAPGAQIEAPNYLWPDPETTHTYKKAGTYEASVRLKGDYGTSEFPAMIKVEPTKKAVAKFECKEPITAEQPAVCNAEASEPTPESKIKNYHWEFGDGTVVNTEHPTTEHAFAASGKYTIKLKITDESKETAEANPQEVTVSAPSVTPPPTTTTTSTTPTTPTTTPTVVTPPIIPVKPVVKPPLTRAQKLAAALKACRKIKSRKHRATCEKQAKTKYGAKTKVKKKSAKKK